jgi:hypothetical protein
MRVHQSLIGTHQRQFYWRTRLAPGFVLFISDVVEDATDWLGPEQLPRFVVRDLAVITDRAQGVWHNINAHEAPDAHIAVVDPHAIGGAEGLSRFQAPL